MIGIVAKIAVAAGTLAVTGAAVVASKIKAAKDKALLESDMLGSVLVCGQTGVGKSSLINYIAGIDGLAKTASGHSCTIGVREYPCDNEGIIFYECEGYYVGDGKLKEFQNRIKVFLKHHPETESVWYCVNAGSERYTDADKENIKKILRQHREVSIIITKADRATMDSFEKVIYEINQDFPELNVYACSNQKSPPEICRESKSKLLKLLKK